MIESDMSKSVPRLVYFKKSDWSEKIKVESKNTQEESEEQDAKNRQKQSYDEVLEKLLETLKDHNATFEMER